MVGSTWVFVGKCLCTRRKVTQPKAANQLSQITQDRERDLPPRWETNPTLLQAASCFQAACFPSFSLSVWSVLLLCLIQLLLFTTTLCLLIEFFPLGDQWVKLLSRVRLFVTPWTVAHQVPQSMEFSRQEYWSGLSFPSPGYLPNPGIKPGSPALQADALSSEPPGNESPGGIICALIWLSTWQPRENVGTAED